MPLPEMVQLRLHGGVVGAPAELGNESSEVGVQQHVPRLSRREHKASGNMKKKVNSAGVGCLNLIHSKSLQDCLWTSLL